ncbi:MAG: phosphoribosylanthranilate isomerase [Solirubrobacteraceae bacterium]|nr:phosphoribosylanthranilate isomerase [Solirubrobacteraceae bacterium]
MQDTRVKICGLTGLDDAEMALEMGAWALGCVMWDGSPRACDPAQAQLIARRLGRSAEICGVFVDAPLDDVSRLVEATGFTMVQLHGDEGPSYCEELGRRTGAKVVKAGRIGSAADLTDMERFRNVDYHLLDTRRTGLPGGTGESWDWELAGQRRSKVPLIVSGGLDAGNVASAIELTRPYAVDVASGVESSPGVKDEEKLRGFFDSVSAAGVAL